MPEDNDICIVTCDASFNDGFAGLGITISWGGKDYTPREVPRRSKTPPHAELLTIERGLRQRTIRRRSGPVFNPVLER